MNQRCSASDGCGHMDGFGHFGPVRTFFKAALCIRVNTVRTLNGVGNGKGDQGFFSFCEFPFCEYSLVVFKEFVSQFRCVFPDVFKLGEIIRRIIRLHIEFSFINRL